MGTLFDPGGDPAAIRRAKVACQHLSGAMTVTSDDLTSTGRRLGEGWEGPAGEA